MTKLDWEREIDQILFEFAEQFHEMAKVADPDIGFKAKDRATHSLKQLLDKAKLSGAIEELERIYREIVKNDIAGPVKWETDDRLTHLRDQLNTKEGKQ